MFWRKLNFTVFVAISLAIHAAFLMTVASPVWNHLFAARARGPISREVTVALVAPPLEDTSDMGEANGVGTGSNKSAGERPLEAREADEDQAFLSRDPRGPGRSDKPSPNSGPLGEGGVGGQTGQMSEAEIVPELATPVAPPAAPNLTKVPPIKDLAIPQPIVHPPEVNQKAIETAAVAVTAPPSVDLPKIAPVSVPPKPKVAMAAPRPVTGDARAPGQAAPQADPAQQSDTESDAFTKKGTITFSDGKLDVRLGRKVKTTRPNILLAGKVDLLTLEGASVVLKIAIDARGNVTDVQVIRSSGSSDVDQPCQVALYDWWFEPTRNKAGTPVPDVLTLTLRFL